MVSPLSPNRTREGYIDTAGNKDADYRLTSNCVESHDSISLQKDYVPNFNQTQFKSSQDQDLSELIN